MDPSNIYTYNPLAPDFLNGIDDFGTPAGYQDNYAEVVYDVLLAAAEIRAGSTMDRLSFDSDFLVRALCGKTDNAPVVTTVQSWNARFIDVDGTEVSNTRLNGGLFTGTGQCPKPVAPEWWIPRGLTVGIEIQNELNITLRVQIVFIGVRRDAVVGGGV